MIRMTAEIELLAGAGEIQTDSISITPSGNNISASIADVVSVRRSGSNPFLFGASKLGNGEVFSSGEPYFIGSELSDENGNFETPYELSFSVYGLDLSNINFSILFDTYNNAYPKTIHATLYYGDSPQGDFIINQAGPLCVFTYKDTLYGGDISFKITFEDWSMPGYPLRIQGIYTGISLYIDKRNLISLSCPIKDRSDNEQPSYGIISNSGSLSIIDGTGEIKEYARMKLLTPDLNVQIWLEDTLTKKKQSIGKFKTNKWTYNNNNFEVNIELKDDLEEWQNYTISGIRFRNFNETAFGVYTFISDEINQIYGYDFVIDEKTEYLLKGIIIENFYLSKGTLWEEFIKLCDIAGLNIYKNNNDEIVVSSDFLG